eukprot:754981-Hanusia_phi.AAC.2
MASRCPALLSCATFTPGAPVCLSYASTSFQLASRSVLLVGSRPLPQPPPRLPLLRLRGSQIANVTLRLPAATSYRGHALLLTCSLPPRPPALSQAPPSPPSSPGATSQARRRRWAACLSAPSLSEPPPPAALE